MPLPYENATSGGQAIEDTKKLLAGFGCTRFGHMTDTTEGVLILQFTHRGRDVEARASYRGFAAAWLKANPWTNRRAVNQKAWEAKALAQAEISVCSVLRDWIKGQVVAIETGVLTFEGAFLGQLLLGNGKTVLQHMETAKLLPAPKP